MSETVDVQTGAKASRPVFLAILCILSFIGSGIWAVISLLTLVLPEKTIRFAYDVIKQDQGPKVEEMLDPAQAEMVRHMEEAMLANMIEYSKMYVIIGAATSLVLALASIIGVAKMWHQQKSGFWIYTAANILAMAGMIYLEGWLGAALALLFIVLYALNLKHLK
jgi:hypothetical protein